MEQYIKIKAYNEDKKFLGTFKLSIKIDYSTPSIDSLSDYNKENKLDESITLYNVPIVYDFDDRTPIQYLKGANVNILLLEEYRYTISFKPNGLLDFEVFSFIRSHSKDCLDLIENSNMGFLSFGSYVGKSFFDIIIGGDTVYEIPFEVRSRKIDYIEQYSAMIGDISKYSQSLIYESSSPLFQSFELDELEEKTGYEEFMLLEYLFKDENLPSTVEYLSRNLYSSLENTVEEVPTSFASNINPNDLIDVFSNSKNLYKSQDEDSIWVRHTKGYVPLNVRETRYVDNIDVAENRFYKNFLERIDSLIDVLMKKSKDDMYVHDKLLQYKEMLGGYLSQGFFKDISPMDYVPLNSQTLQKREGYRDILSYYLMFELGFHLNWDEVSSEFRGGEKKLYELYEYWCYFELFDLLDGMSSSSHGFYDIFSFDKESLRISLSHDLMSSFVLDLDGYSVDVDLLYNKSFTRGSPFRSYSVLLRPDYSLIVHIGDGDYIIHFDAKYKLNINDDSFKNVDIVKMHAYKDAIEGTVGAYVLYPGSVDRIYDEHDSGIESVGAFGLVPGSDADGRNSLRDFILNLLRKLIGDV